MRHSLLLALWSSGALGSPCKPSRPAQSSLTSGAPDENHNVPSGASSTYDLTLSSQYSALETSTASADDDDGEVTVSIHSSGDAGNSGSPSSEGLELTEDISATGTATDRPGQPSGDATGFESSTFEGVGSTQVPGTGTATDVPGQPSGDAPNSGSPSSEGSELTEGSATGTATGLPERSSGAAAETETSLGGNGSTEDASGAAPGTVSPGETSGDASGSATVSGEPGLSGDASATATVTGIPGDASDDATGSATFSAGESGATGDVTDERTDGVPAPTDDNPGSSKSGSPGSPDETISAPGNSATGTEQGQDSADATTTPSDGTEAPVDTSVPVTTDAGGENSSQTGSETSGSGSEQSSETIPGNTASDGQTQSPGTEDLPATTKSGDLTEGESATVPTDSNGVPTGTTGPQDTTTKSPDDGNTSEATSLGSENSSAAGTSEGTQPSETDSEQPSATDSNANQSTTYGDEATTEPGTGNSDLLSVEPSSANDGPSTNEGVTTADASATTDSNNDIPSTTAASDGMPSVTSNPATTDAPTGTSLPVVTDVPAGFAPSTVSGHPEWTSNTWITTTSGDSSEPTIVPVLVGCKNCGGKGSGIILWNFPKTTGTWFKFPGLPKFNFPCIPPGCTAPPNTSESGEDGNDEDDDDDDESSSTSCSDQVTVTDCFVACTTYTGPAGETITPDCSTTCTKTHTGCSVTGTTTTSSAEACGPSGDSSCNKCITSLEDDDDVEPLERRDLERRSPKDPQKDIAMCKWAGQNPKMPYFPEYPGGGQVLYNEAAIAAQPSSPLSQIKRWWRTTWDNNCMPTLSGPIPESAFPRGLSHDVGPSIDHIYEKSMLLDYFMYIIDSTPGAVNVKGMSSGSAQAKISCNDLDAYSGITLSASNLVQDVFNTYPQSDGNGPKKIMVTNEKYFDDFIGMDQWTNSEAKGFISNAEKIYPRAQKLASKTRQVGSNTAHATAETWVTNKLGLLERLAIGIQMFNYPDSIAALERQTQRIYARLVDIDDNAKNCMNDDAVKNNIWSFADRFKDYMNDRFAGTATHSINNEVVKAKTLLIDELRNDMTAAASNTKIVKAELAKWRARLNNLDKPSQVWEVTGYTWDWTYVTKRDGKEGSCKLPIPSRSSDEPSAFTTSTREATSDLATTSDLSTTDELTSSTEETPSSTYETTSSTSEESSMVTELPVLTLDGPEATISAPEGSSCVETLTFTQCLPGSGGRELCVVRPGCVSWINTEPTSTTEETTSTTSASPTPTLEEPDPSQNSKECYDSGQRANYDSITAAAESFCHDVEDDDQQGPVWSNYTLNGKKQPSQGYHFKLSFGVAEGCVWDADFDDCMRYMKVPIDSCDCSAMGNKQGGTVTNNCIMAMIDPNSGT